ncbi:hypothetical protein FC093_08310 [Ilyomonas limi]|uniref:histidine kinase n=1 Tax=Ilyomonas limi TaxID=2575867 RepID=A0A4U3L4P6_9BACT|nr:ATP-binding protein [Ilyomonas limi]TKK69309.1 hypothetical protein FC093_08310 [Ilyomonas limi]
MNKYTWLIIVLLYAVCPVFAQSISIDETVTTPSKEIYDLLQDSKGFIWIADELGVRRYDGVAFTNYSHPLQAAMSMTDLVEDKQGRIWCHNFSGQIFYIEHEQMHLLSAYDGTAERFFPRIAICGDELLATTSKGLFVCNTKTMEYRYIMTSVSGTSSLCVMNNTAVLHGDSLWYMYRKDKGLAQFPAVKVHSANLSTDNFTLQPVAKGDTIYAISNPGALLITFTFLNNQLKLQNIEQCNSFVNAVTIRHGEAWVHTKAESRLLTFGKSIKGYNLSCILKDKDGNTWYGSLDKGLLVSYAHQSWSIVKDSALTKGDFIKSIRQSDDYFVTGSQQGVLLVKDKKQKSTKLYALPAGAGSIDKIELLPKNTFLIAASVGLYLLQPATGYLRCLHKILVVKDMAYNQGVLLIGTSKGLLQEKIDTATGAVLNFSYRLMLKGEQRCRAVKYNKATGALWIAYTDGLYRWHKNKLEPVLYNGLPIYASSLEYSSGKIYAGTFSGSLIVIQEDTSGKYQFEKYTFNSAVIRMKLYQNHLWIFNAFGVNTFDIGKETFIYNQNIPYLDGSEVWDATEVGQDIYLATIGNLYKIQVQQAVRIHPPSLYLQYVSVNNQDTIFDNGARLKHSQNNLSFYTATPWYNKYSNVAIRYRLASTNNDHKDNMQWYNLERNERIIQLNALAPGTYMLTMRAGINGNFQLASSLLVYRFTIIEPWYNQWWFYLLIAVVLTALLFGLYKYRVNQLLKMERLRREISSNLHDDVGSTVSSINIYSQLLKNGQRTTDYIDMIQANTAQVMNSLDELVWNINPKYDLLEQLINKMKMFAVPLLSDNHIVCHFDVTVEKENKILLPNVRTDVYMIFKEAINNVIKHAQCSHCDIHILQAGKLLTLSVKDDGNGFDAATAALHRNGISSMQDRARKIKGRFSIFSEPGRGTQITLVCNLGNI